MELAQHLPTLLIALIVVVGMIYGIGFLARRSRLWQAPASSGVEILSSTYLGPKEKLLLLRVRDREILVGMGPTHMCALSEFAANPDTS